MPLFGQRLADHVAGDRLAATSVFASHTHEVAELLVLLVGEPLDLHATGRRRQSVAV